MNHLRKPVVLPIGRLTVTLSQDDSEPITLEDYAFQLTNPALNRLVTVEFLDTGEDVYIFTIALDTSHLLSLEAL